MMEIFLNRLGLSGALSALLGIGLLAAFLRKVDDAE